MRRTTTVLIAVLSAATLAPAGTHASGLPADCPITPVPQVTATNVPVTQKRCIPPESFTVSGRSLGFTDTFAIDWVRPGINLGPCSTSFMLTDDVGNLYLTQSAHCVFARDTGNFCTSDYAPIGSKHEIEGYGSVAELTWVSGEHMKQYGGTAAECGSWDVAILRVPDSLRAKAHPAIRHTGGPTGLVDPLTVRHRDPVNGYGNSDDRGFVVETVTRDDHGNAPVWPHVNTFSGHFVGNVLDEAVCPPSAFTACWHTSPYFHGMRAYVRYVPTKITGDSGSADMLADGRALGVTSVINFATILMGTSPLYDTLVRIWFDTGVHYRVVTWDEWSPTTIET